MKLLHAYLLFVLLIGCASYSDDEDEIRGVFPSVSVTETESQTPAQVPIPLQSTVELEPAINNEMVQQDNKDLTAPKLLESTVDSGRVDPNTDVISLRFNQEITEIDIKLVDNSDVSLGWIPSIDTITGRRLFLTRINGRRLTSGNRTYYIKGFVKDKNGNKTSIDIEFRAVEENRDRTPPVILTQSVNHEARNVSINTDQFVFTFSENITEAKVRLVRGENWQTGTDMRWTRFIDKKTVVLLKTTGKGFRLRKGETYTIVLSAGDASGNWTPGGNQVWIIRFTTHN